MTAPTPEDAESPVPGKRTRALWQGAAGVLGSMVIFFVGAFALSRLGAGSEKWIAVVFFGALAAVILGVWKLGVARDHRWDGRGLLALALMVLGYPLLLLFATWSAMALYTLVTGERFVPYSH